MRYPFKLSSIKIFIVVILISGCEQDFSEEADQLSLNFQEELTIGEDVENISDEAMLASPVSVKTSGDGTILIADSRLSAIKAYDSEGNYLRSIGQQGKGPGEFTGTPVFELTEDDELTTFNFATQMISRFSLEGDLLETSLPEMDDMVWSTHVRQVNGNNYAVLRKLPDPNGEDESLSHHSKVLHLFDGSFENRITSIGQIDSLIINAESGFVELHTVNSGVGVIWPNENGDIWYAPAMYNGRLFRFSGSAGSWELAETVQGTIKVQEPVTLLDGNGADEEASITYTVFTGDGPFSGIINSESLGIFTLSDGRLVHISSQLLEDERQTFVEVFNRQGQLEGVGQLEEFTFPGTETNALIEYIWKDENDRFYFIDNSDVPVIRIGRIEGL